MIEFLKKWMGASASSRFELDPDAFLVDVRTPSEYAQGHVHGSTNIPLDQIPRQLNRFRNRKQIVVFCRSGNRSSQAKAFLDANGITNVVNGGTWQQMESRLNLRSGCGPFCGPL